MRLKKKYGDESESKPMSNPYAQEVTTSPVLHWLFRRISFMVKKKMFSLQQKCLCRWIAALTTQIRGADIRPYLFPMITPLTAIARTQKVWLKDLATEVLHIVKGAAGSTAFNEVFGQIEQAYAIRKARFKRAGKILLVKDPKEFYKLEKDKQLIRARRQARDPRKKHRLPLLSKSEDLVAIRQARKENQDVKLMRGGRKKKTKK